MSRKKNTLPHTVQRQLSSIGLTALPIILDQRQIDVIRRYRQAKQAMSEAMRAALTNERPDAQWLPADREAVDAADAALRVCQIEMCALLDVAALMAGVQ